MYYPTFLYCLNVNYDLSWFVQINMKLLTKVSCSYIILADTSL